jgi:hypothetical protein
VLGLGREYETYAQKVEWYHEEIVASPSPVADSDLIVMVDAYDVLFTPAVRHFGKVCFPPRHASPHSIPENGPRIHSDRRLRRERRLSGALLRLVLPPGDPLRLQVPEQRLLDWESRTGLLLSPAPPF